MYYTVSCSEVPAEAILHPFSESGMKELHPATGQMTLKEMLEKTKAENAALRNLIRALNEMQTKKASQPEFMPSQKNTESTDSNFNNSPNTPHNI